ncbi:MAG: relaxase/mobilization nuclease domain-containing protein [Flavobacteriaceae bacterium]|nr:relaxase/mobilization nuclease domain-containing protein [Flavobacteriaceae bacterium]
MIGKGKSISHTRASMSYGWDQDNSAEVVLRQNMVGENPKELTQEFKRIQNLNQNCQRNTLSFVISPTIQDGQRLGTEELKKVTAKFMERMKLGDRQAIAFVHRNKEHTHIHLYVNRIDFQGRAYQDSFIGKRSQQAAAKVAEEMKLTTVKQVQFERDFDLKELKAEIKRRHDLTMAQFRPKDFDQYIETMRANGVKVLPSINKRGELQGFRFSFNGQDFKGSEVHRKMGMGTIGKDIQRNAPYRKLLSPGNKVALLGKLVPVPKKMALSLAKTVIKKSIRLGMGI